MFPPGLLKTRVTNPQQRAVNCIDKIDVPKKTSKPILIHLRPNFEILAEMKVLHFYFLDDDGKWNLLLESTMEAY